MAAFERLIRFEDAEGKTLYGNLEKEVPTKDIQGSTVEVLEGDVKSGFKKTGSKATVSKACSIDAFVSNLERVELIKYAL